MGRRLDWVEEGVSFEEKAGRRGREREGPGRAVSNRNLPIPFLPGKLT